MRIRSFSVGNSDPMATQLAALDTAVNDWLTANPGIANVRIETATHQGALVATVVYTPAP